MDPLLRIVDIGQVDPDGVTGTGAAVAELLGRSGLAVKVSQDGTVEYVQCLRARDAQSMIHQLAEHVRVPGACEDYGRPCGP